MQEEGGGGRYRPLVLVWLLLWPLVTILQMLGGVVVAMLAYGRTGGSCPSLIPAVIVTPRAPPPLPCQVMVVANSLLPVMTVLPPREEEDLTLAATTPA